MFRNRWVSGLRPLSGILNTRENTTFWKPGSFPSSGEGGGDTLLGALERANLQSLVYETLCFLVFRIPDDRQSSDTQWF
jgi:hypothetical protein